MERSTSYTRRFTRNKSLQKTVLETYTRPFIPCGFTCCTNEGYPLTTIVIPTYEVLTEYLPLFQTKHTKSIILHSTLRQVQEKSNIEYKKIRETTSHQFIFYNDYFMETFTAEKCINEKGTDEKCNDGSIRVNDTGIGINEFGDNKEYLKFIKVLEFYMNHVPDANIIILTKSNIKSFPSLCDNPDLISDLIIKVEKEKTVYTEYLNNDLLEAMRIEGKVYCGILFNSAINCFSGVVHTEFKGRQIRIRIVGRNNMNRALNTDGVYVEVIGTENNATPDLSVANEVFGRIVGLYKREFRPIIGTIDSRTIHGTGPQYVLVIPLDRKLPKIRIRTSRVECLENKRIMVRINEWDVESNYPFGSYVSQIGDVGDEKSEIESILISNGIDYENYKPGFGLEDVIENLRSKIIHSKEKAGENSKRIRHDKEQPDTENLDPENLKSGSDDLHEIYHMVVESESAARVDFRDYEVVSIDPPGCTDIDDAMHCRLVDGITEVGIHIADVSFFVEKDSVLDKEALKRGTTVYLTDRRLDMLPNFLSSGLCSLVENESRLTFSVLLYFDANFKIIKRKFHKGIIQSKRSFTYEEAQNEIDSGCKQFSGLARLNEIAKHLRKNRIDSGALELSSCELKIFSKKNKKQDTVVENIEQKKLFDTNSLVEEFMLIANIEVAKMIYSRNKDSSLLRRHPKFADDSFDELKDFLAKRNIDLNCLSSKELNDSIKKIEDGDFKSAVKKIITRSMNQATYFSSGSCPYEDFLHYGLSVPIYTHFTSPIRRYADLIVHRQLSETFHGVNSFTCDDIAEVCRQINYRNKSAMHANLDCDRLFVYLYLKGKSIMERAFVIKTGATFAVLYIPNLGIEEGIKMDCDYNEENGAFMRDGVRFFGLYDNVKVQIVENDEKFFVERKFDIQIIE